MSRRHQQDQQEGALAKRASQDMHEAEEENREDRDNDYSHRQRPLAAGSARKADESLEEKKRRKETVKEAKACPYLTCAVHSIHGLRSGKSACSRHMLIKLQSSTATHCRFLPANSRERDCQPYIPSGKANEKLASCRDKPAPTRRSSKTCSRMHRSDSRGSQCLKPPS